MTAALPDAWLTQLQADMAEGWPSHAEARKALEKLVAEVRRLKAEPRLWHSETLGYVAVESHDDHYDVMTDAFGALFPTMDTAAEYVDYVGGRLVVAAVVPLDRVGP